MKKEHEEYFSKKMNEMADKFNQAALRPRPDIKASVGPAFEVDKKLADEANAFATTVYNEFKQAGYSDKEWADLYQRSSAKKKMDGMGSHNN